MRQGVKNTFFKGMIKDLSDSMKDPSSYEDAFDIRLNSNDSDSEHIIVNIKGNRFSFNIPDTPNILTITPNDVPDTWTSNVAILHSGGITFGNSISGTSDISDMMDKIEDSLRNSPTFTSLNLNVARNGTIIRVWSNTVDLLNYNTSSSLTTTTLQLKQTDQKPIGWTRIDDNIYIISTNNDTDAGGIATFNKFTYDKVSLQPTIQLIYSNDLKMSTRYPIANPGGIESVMETEDIERTYWTDRFNDLRTMNLADPNVMALSVEQLLTKPIVKLSKPILKSVQLGGSLPLGHYQVTYGLRTLGGGLTSYAPTSNSIFITDSLISGDYSDYQGNNSGIITSQSFTIEISDIDTSFEFIDIVILRVENADSSPYIYKVAELSVTGSTMTYTHTGTEPSSIITEDAFNRRINMFDKCQAIAQKDNILFAANTTRKPFDIDFDARAYRFNDSITPKAGITDINNSPTVEYELSQLNTISETDDAINPDQDIYRYQSDGQTLGGEGPNVKYEFTYRSLAADTRNSGDYIYPYRLPWRVGDTATIELGDGTLYTEGGHYSDFKSPHIDHIYKGYRRGETYRLSAVPVKNGVEGYAKWIADIKMPNIFEDYQTGFSLDAPENQGKIFPLTSSIDGIWHVNTLGIKITINTPLSLVDQIDEWRIKRVKLEPEDRTIIAQGIIHQCIKDSTQSPPTYHPDMGESLSFLTLNSDTADSIETNTTINGQVYNFGHKIVTFHSPDLLFQRVLEHRPGDKIKVVQGSATHVSTLNKNPAPNMVLWKLYQGAPVMEHLAYGDERDVTHGQSASFDDDFLIDNFPFENRSRFNGGDRTSRGTDSTVLVLDKGLEIFPFLNVFGSGVNWSNTGRLPIVPATKVADKYLVNYIRQKDGQYGGKGYTARTQNVYVNTGAIIKVNADTLETTVNVYGGDTYVNIFDTLKMTKNFIDFEDTGDGAKRMAVGLYYACESFVNTDLRHGYTLNGTQNPSGGFYATADDVADPEEYPIDYGEDFKYNYVFSEQMVTQRSFPKPLNIVDTLRHPVRIWASSVKVYGELTDAWKIFDSERYIDIQGDLGEIRQLVNSSDQIVAWQQRGFGIASVNERSVVNDNIGGGIVLGQSGVLPRFDYISKSIGAWHQFSFITSPNGTMFFDAKDGGLYLYSSEGLKDVSTGKLKSWLYENTRGNILKHDSPLPTNNITRIGICGTYDIRNKEFLMTFYDNLSNKNNNKIFDTIGRSFTVAYNDTQDRFVSFRSFKPIMYINDGNNIFTADPSNENNIYIHEKGDRGVFYNNDASVSHVIITVNALPDTPKVFDNTEWSSEVLLPSGVELPLETINEISSYNSYQTTGIRTDIVRRLRSWRHAITYELNTRNRIRSHWMKQKFSFLNNNNKEFKLHSIINLFRPFPK